MPSVETYDIAGSHPEKEKFIEELKQVESDLAGAKSTLNHMSFEAGMDAWIAEQHWSDEEFDRVKKQIAALKSRCEEIRNELFRISPSEER